MTGMIFNDCSGDGLHDVKIVRGVLITFHGQVRTKRDGASGPTSGHIEIHHRQPRHCIKSFSSCLPFSSPCPGIVFACNSRL